eukprot:TRINITY_DN9628_c0_g1_i1.p1 TRINITY_DN9628_c0_g1~~TRINITY_DN9628_c0_g1_i1.p1  ORF type:complete len:466 (+),score=75.52 TRINITY_DN9628_c0_g1_i1:179-1576(+)
MNTPNIDKLAQGGVVFEHAYAQQALCNPTRSSLLTGRRPDTTKCWSFQHDFRQTNASWVTLPQYFKNNGYITTGMGKIFHPNLPPNNDPPSWSPEYAYFDPTPGSCPNERKSCPTDEPDDFFADGKIANTAVTRLEQLVQSNQQPFFLAVGFHKPHLDWYFPKKYFDLYPETVDPPKYQTSPKNMPEIAFFSCGNINSGEECKSRNVSIKPDTPLPSDIVNLFRRSYYGAVSFTDAQIGKVLDKLEALGLQNNTIVVLWGDHGWQLGEHGEWCKQTNFELATQVPLIYRVPWKTNSIGVTISSFTEFLDIYPTLVELAGLSKPTDGIEGISFASLFDQPTAEIRNVTISQYPRCCENSAYHNGTCKNLNVDCGSKTADQFKLMGYTLRSENWRFTEWYEWNKETERAILTNPIGGVELYDHKGDNGNLDDYENVNLAHNSDYADVVQRLREDLRSTIRSWRNEEM